MVKAVLFDLDGTLLPMDQEKFIQDYFGRLAQKFAMQGYEPKKLIETVWAGTKAMIGNKGEKKNETVFWDLFYSVYGEDDGKAENIFLDFYTNEFNQVKNSCGFEPMAEGVVRALKEKNVRVVVATNPLFPAVATQNRMRWAGLNPEEIEYFTTYENTHYCKPNTAYYQEILDRIGLKPEECMMVGNDVDEDMVASTLGMEVFLLTDCLINKSGKDIAAYPHGNFGDLSAKIQQL